MLVENWLISSKSTIETPKKYGKSTYFKTPKKVVMKNQKANNCSDSIVQMFN